jgi:hypothetical protein
MRIYERLRSTYFKIEKVTTDASMTDPGGNQGLKYRYGSKTGCHWYDRLPQKPIKIGLNLNFKFEKQKTGIPVSITGKPAGAQMVKKDYKIKVFLYFS